MSSSSSTLREMALIGKHEGDFYIVMETTPLGRIQVELGKKDKIFEIPSQTCGFLYEPAPVALGRGESIIVYDSHGKVIMES